MPDTITGPGIGIGGPSEIAAVSVGIYAVDNTGMGFARARAKAEEQGAQIGKSVKKGIAKGGVEGQPEMKGGEGGWISRLIFGRGHDQFASRRKLHHAIAGWFFGPMIIAEAFEFGQKIRNSLLGGLEERLEQELERMQKKLGEGFRRITDAWAESMEKVNADRADLGLNRVFDTAAIRDKAQQYNEIVETIMKDQADFWGEWFRSGPIIGGLMGFKETHDKLMDDLRKQQKSLGEEIQQLQTKARKLAASVASEAQRLKSQHGADISATPVDIGALRNAVSVTSLQRFQMPVPSGVVARSY